MTDTTARLALPLIAPGQAQKELFHNEALALLDLAAQASVVAVGIDTPPASPLPGQTWIVGAAPTDAWAGRAGALAGWTAGGWRFLAATEGMSAWDQTTGQLARYTGGSWALGTIAASRVTVGGLQVVGARRPAIADATGGTVVDAEARTAIEAILAALRDHGLIAA